MIHPLNVNTIDAKTSELHTYVKCKCITITKLRSFSIIIHNKSMLLVAPDNIPPEIQLEDSNVFIVYKNLSPRVINTNIDMSIPIDIGKYLLFKY